MINGKYKNILPVLFDQYEKIEASGGIESLMAQQQAAEEARMKKEERERIKKEKEKRERIEKQRENIAKNCIVMKGVLTGWYGNEKHLKLPEGLANAIGTAFRWKSGLESIALPMDITLIQARAFYGSSSLKKVSIPSSVKEIGAEAFSGCASLSEISLPAGIKEIAERLFDKCASLTRIVIPAGVKKISSAAFSECRRLEEIIIPEGVAEINDLAFSNCTNLQTIVFPNSVKKIGKNVFNGCTALEHVSMGNGLKRIPEACFMEQKQLLDVSVAADLAEIGDRAFKNCQRLKHLLPLEANRIAKDKGLEFEGLISNKSMVKSRTTMLNDLEHIGKSAFEGCFAFAGIDLPDGMESLSDYAFANCRNMKEINLPRSLRFFGNGVFSGCASLAMAARTENVNWHRTGSFAGTPWLATQAENGCVISDGYLEAYTGMDESIEIPDEVNIIGRNAFDGNAHVEEITIPDGVTIIEDFAFANCTNLKKITIPDSVAEIADNAFVNDADLMFRCTRGSAASAFRIQNKIPVEYIAKSKSKELNAHSRLSKKSDRVAADRLSGLTEEEYRVVMEMRREKLSQKTKEKEPEIIETVDYEIVAADPNKVSLNLLDDNRTISNNIFTLRFQQIAEATDSAENAEYETFVIDAFGRTISNIRALNTANVEKSSPYRVTYTLGAQEKFDKAAECYVVLRYKDAGTKILSKVRYKINIAFASDFDF